MTMIASILYLDRKSIKELKVKDTYSLHRIVYDLYDDIRDADEKQSSKFSGILYADQGGDHKGRKILTLANRPIRENAIKSYREVQSKLVPDNLLEFSYYRFKVVVNPTRRDSKSGKLVPVRTREAICEWFVERAIDSWGFRVDVKRLQIGKVEIQQFKDKKKREITVAQAHIQGILEVTDQERFKHSFTHGIGRARAWGCGLLQIVPISDQTIS